MSSTKDAPEPFTGTRLPYAADGTGIDEAASHALLMQAMLTTSDARKDPNALLISMLWRRDWYSWAIGARDAQVSRRTMAFAAVTAGMRQEPEQRLYGALLNAGLAAQRGLQTWLRRRGYIKEEPRMIEPLEGLRAALFSSDKPTDPFFEILNSPLHVYTDVPLTATVKGGRIQLSWLSPDSAATSMVFVCAGTMAVEAGSNLSGVSASAADGVLTVRCQPAEAGICSLSVTLSAGANLPHWRAPTSYSEPLK
jgi:hypothetical protein